MFKCLIGVNIYKRASGRQYLLLRPSSNAPQGSPGFNEQEHQLAAEDFFVLDRFVEHMLLEDYSPTLFANSFSQAFASQHEANANMRLPPDAIKDVHARETDLAGRHR